MKALLGELAVTIDVEGEPYRVIASCATSVQKYVHQGRHPLGKHQTAVSVAQRRQMDKARIIGLQPMLVAQTRLLRITVSARSKYG